jgi:hypothetical protein
MLGVHLLTGAHRRIVYRPTYQDYTLCAAAMKYFRTTIQGINLYHHHRTVIKVIINQSSFISMVIDPHSTNYASKISSRVLIVVLADGPT